MSADPRIDNYIAAAAPFARPILTHLRALVHAALPGVAETIKWGMPHYTLGGKNMAGMAAFKAHAAFVIHGEGRVHQGEGMGAYGKIASLADLPSDADLTARLHAAREARAKPAPKPAKPRTAKPDLPIPAEFALALTANPAAQATLAAFAPSHRREYVEWVSEAKTLTTRNKRIDQSIAWLAEGKKRNWKYEKC